MKQPRAWENIWSFQNVSSSWGKLADCSVQACQCLARHSVKPVYYQCDSNQPSIFVAFCLPVSTRVTGKPWGKDGQRGKLSSVSSASFPDLLTRPGRALTSSGCRLWYQTVLSGTLCEAVSLVRSVWMSVAGQQPPATGKPVLNVGNVVSSRLGDT